MSEPIMQRPRFRKLCEHPDFEAHVLVNRIEDTGRFVADVHVRCAVCKVRFAFVGLESGLHPREPRVSPDRFELRAPIEPDAHATMMMAGDPMLGFPTDVADPSKETP